MTGPTKSPRTPDARGLPVRFSRTSHGAHRPSHRRTDDSCDACARARVAQRLLDSAPLPIRQRRRIRQMVQATAAFLTAVVAMKSFESSLGDAGRIVDTDPNI